MWPTIHNCLLPSPPPHSHSHTHTQQRAGAHDIQLALDCVLRCSRELCTHTITTEEFHESVDLILTTLTPHTNLLAMPTSSENGAEFGEAGRQKLASQSLSERRLQLSGMVSTNASSINQVYKEHTQWKIPTHNQFQFLYYKLVPGNTSS